MHVPQGKGNENKGIAFVRYREPGQADAARLAMDGKSFGGRLMHVLPASKAPNTSIRGSGVSDDNAAGGFKQRRKADLKTRADQPFNWSTLYMDVSFALLSEGSDAIY